MGQTVAMSGGEPVATATTEERRSIQKRTVRVLLFSQGSGGVGLVATYIVTALLAKDITGSKSLATVAAAFLSIGAAGASFPLAKLMNTHGRRVGLRTGYLIGATGAAIALLAAITRSYPLLCIGVFGAGAGNAANLATRYAASDLARRSTGRARSASSCGPPSSARRWVRCSPGSPATRAKLWGSPPRPAPTCCRG